MYSSFLETYYQIREAFTEGSFKNLVCKRIFLNRVAIPVEMHLDAQPGQEYKSTSPDYRFLELKTADIRGSKWAFTVPSRQFKACRNIKKGFRCFALVKDATVLGDLWCASPCSSENPVAHPDLKMLGISCRANEAYAFDMLIDPAYRGKNLAIPLQRSLHTALKSEGIRKVYGFYWQDNIPALWMHRMLKFKELPKRIVSRFFFLHQARSVPFSVPSLSETTEGFQNNPSWRKT